MESLVSREAAFLYNNLFLVAFALTVLWGVAYPIVSEAVRGVASTVGAPYFDFFGIVFGLPLVLLMGIGPLDRLAAGVASPARRRAWLWPAAAALGCGVVLLALGAGSSVLGLVAYTFAAFVLAAIVLEFVRGTRARKGLGEASWPAAFTSLVARNRRRYGGYIVHASIALLAIGAIGIGAYGTESIRKLEPGGSMQAGDYTLDLRRARRPSASQIGPSSGPRSTSRAGGDDLGTIAAGKNRYLEGDAARLERGRDPHGLAAR